MQSKLLTAAAIVTSASAITLKAPSSVLAGPTPSTDLECHGSYAYQCVQQKVDNTLGNLRNGVTTTKDGDVTEVNDLRENMIEQIQDMRATTMQNLGDMRADQTDALNNQLSDAMDKIQKTTEDIIAGLEQQVADSQSGNSPLALKRKQVEGEMKKIYYKDSQNNSNAREDVKAEIRTEVEKFAEYAKTMVPNFGEAGLIELNQVIDEEVEALANAITEALKAWNDAAEAMSKNMSDAIDQRVKKMEYLNVEKKQDMEARITKLTEDYIAVFWDTVDEIYKNVNYNERQGLIWKALYQKDAFIATVQLIRDELVAKLGDNLVATVDALNAERNGMATWIGEQRVGMQADTKSMNDALQLAADGAEDNLEAKIDELAKALTDENAELKNFVYDLATIRFSPKGNGASHANGYQPYGKWVSNRITKNIRKYGDASLDTQATTTAAATDVTLVTLNSEIDGLIADGDNVRGKVNAKTQDLIEQLQAKREAIEVTLAEQDQGIMDTVTDTRSNDQIELITIKNNMWKELSWIIRSTLSSTKGHKHGYSAGPVYGYRLVMAQVQDKSYPGQAQDDGYDPYGYGDFGYGYGASQTQYKEIQQKLNTMEAAYRQFEDSAGNRKDAARVAMLARQTEAFQAMEEAIAAKMAYMNATIDAQTKVWEAAKAARTATMEKAFEAARKAITLAKTAALDALDSEEKEVRWAITAIYNYEEQDKLNKALTEARNSADRECERTVDKNVKKLGKMMTKWQAAMNYESEDFEANNASALQKCNEAKQDQKDLLTAFAEQKSQAYDNFESGEDSTVEDFLTEAKSAWDDILVSYCLKHGLDGDLKVGYGCSLGSGAGAGNGGYKKGVEIEKNMDVLTKGQGAIDIKHINDEPWLIENAKNFMMQGVGEEANKLQTSLASANSGREQALIQARKDLEDALNKRVWEQIGQMEDQEKTLAYELRDREVSSMLDVVDFREGREERIDKLRDELLWDIKELVWKLGYSQGYHYGAHDGHDAELMQMITEKKDSYQLQIESTIQLMKNRALQETRQGDRASEAAIKTLDDLQDLFNAELEQKIQESTEKLLATIEAGNSDCEADQKAAKDALTSFIAGRMAVWQTKYDAEESTAKWQQDSYYRFSLIRLLNEKQAAIDAAVENATSAFNQALSRQKETADLSNGAQRESWANFVVDLRQQLADAIKKNDDKMLATVTERSESLAKQLQEQTELLALAMEEDQSIMKKNLKEIYNFNSHDRVEAKKSTGKAAPYNHEQHQAFLYKLAYYMKDQLRQMDANLANMSTRYEMKMAASNEGIADYNRDAQERVLDLKDALVKQLGKATRAQGQQRQNQLDAELGLIKDTRTAAEEATILQVEAIRKNVIYAMHVLRYGGGKDSLDTGFGKAASSYLGLGNSLTGIDTLDNFRLQNPHNYAQVSDKINSQDEHFTKLQDMLSDSKAEFDTVIKTARDEFAAKIAEAKADAVANAQADKQAVTEAAAGLKAQLVDQITKEMTSMADQIRAYKGDLVLDTTNQVTAFNANVDGRMDAIQGWFADRLAWLDQLNDSYMKKHLKKELEKRMTSDMAKLQERKDEAQKNADEANQLLWNNLNAMFGDLEDYNVEINSEMNGTILATRIGFNIAADALAKAFEISADEQNTGLDERLDQVTEDWAFWLKYFYGFDGYETSLYKDYDELADYSNVFNYARGDGAYLDLGHQGAGGSQGGFSHLSGYGYGGVGAHDYLYSGDHTGLVYGKEIGPNPDYFSGSILDAADPMDEMTPDAMIANMMDKYAGSMYNGLQF